MLQANWKQTKNSLPVSAVTQMNLWMAHCVYKGLDADDKMLWRIITGILASCVSYWFIVWMLSLKPVWTLGVFCHRLLLLSEHSAKTLKTFSKTIWITIPTTTARNSYWNKKCSSSQPANQHAQLWSYLALTPQPPLIGPLLPRYSAHCCAVGP